MVSIAPVKPGLDLAFELGHIRNTAVQALAGQDRQLQFRHIEPAAMLGREAPLETLNETPRFLRRECLRSYNDAGVCVFRLSCTSTIFSALAKWISLSSFKTCA